MKPTTSQWAAPSGAILLSAILAVWVLALPNDYQDHHNWPVLLVITAFVFGIIGLCKLFWLAIPACKTAQALFGLGFVLMLICWLGASSIPGVIVGAVVTLIGAGMMALQSSRQ